MWHTTWPDVVPWWRATSAQTYGGSGAKGSGELRRDGRWQGHKWREGNVGSMVLTSAVARREGITNGDDIDGGALQARGRIRLRDADDVEERGRASSTVSEIAVERS